MRSICIYIFVVCLATSVFSQTIPYVNYTSEDGLPSSSIYSVYQDEIGYIWLATDYGVSRFNGYEFDNFHAESISNTITSFSEDTAGILYFTTDQKETFYFFNDSIHKIDGNPKFKRIQTNVAISNPEIKSILHAKTVTDIIVDYENSTWVTTLEHGLFYFPYLPEVTNLSQNTIINDIKQSNNRILKLE